MRGAISAAAIAACSLVYGLLLARLRRFDLARPPGRPPWWFGYSRDGVNLLACALYAVCLRVAGFAGPPSLVLAAALVLACYLVDWLVGRRLASARAPIAVFLLGGAAACAITFGAPAVDAAVEALLAVAKPR